MLTREQIHKQSIFYTYTSHNVWEFQQEFASMSLFNFWPIFEGSTKQEIWSQGYYYSQINLTRSDSEAENKIKSDTEDWFKAEQNYKHIKNKSSVLKWKL